VRPLAAVLLLALVTGTSAQDHGQPAPGAFLVSKGIDRGPFHQSVVLLLKHGEKGTLGVIVNRPTDVLLSEAIPDLDPGDVPRPLYFGGPVGLEGLLVLFRNRSQAPPAGAEEVLEGVYYSGQREVLEGLLKGHLSSDEMRLFVGHSGWGPGQLAGELRRRSWDVMPASPFTLFRTDPLWMWETLTEGRTIARRLHAPLFGS
jgi:putative transcriptional regulator